MPIVGTERLTELGALNQILATIGSSPITGLDNPQNADALAAAATLQMALREVQTERWYFNTEENYTFPIDVDGYIFVPSNLMSVDVNGRFGENLDVTIRGTRLYDRTNHTYVFTKPVTLNVQWCLAFEELPETAKLYITAKASRSFQETMLGDPHLREWTIADEGRTRGALVAEDLAQRKLSFGAIPRIDPNRALDLGDI